MEIRGKKVAVVGLGATAVALAKLLLREGARPYVTELRATESILAHKAELDALGVWTECGGHTSEAFREAAFVIPSPGVPPGIPVIQEAVAAGAVLFGEMELASRFCRAPILAVTGTNGKTTTTELLHKMLLACGHRAALAGNNARPLSTAAMLDPAPEYVVVEVSSYQLETIDTFRPWLASVLNVTPDHLARHGSLEQYARVKARIFKNQREGDAAILNWDEPGVRAMWDQAPGRRLAFSAAGPVPGGIWVRGGEILEGKTVIAGVAGIPLRGRHNLENALAALAMARAGGFNWAGVLEGLRHFPGVEHRLEPVGRVGGVEFINDSKSTNIDSLRVALESFDARVVLICGGQGKGADYGVLRSLVARRAKHVVTLGEDAPLIEQAFAGAAPVSRANDMSAAVRCAAERAGPGGTVLLSPACASFDMFANFEERGRVFKECVEELARSAGGADAPAAARGRGAECPR